MSSDATNDLIFGSVSQHLEMMFSQSPIWRGVHALATFLPRQGKVPGAACWPILSAELARDD